MPRWPSGPQEVCLTFYGVTPGSLPVGGVGDPVFVRDNESPESTTRYCNGIQHNIADGRILMTAHNDGGVQADGILWGRLTQSIPSGPFDDVVIGKAVDMPGTYIQPQNAWWMDDRRMDTGLVAPPGNQWIPAAPYGALPLPPTYNSMDFRAHLTVGEAIVPLTTTTFASGWSLSQHLVRILGQAYAEAGLHWRRVFTTTPLDRVDFGGRLGTYITGTTTSEAFTDWAVMMDPPGGGPFAPHDYLFLLRGGTSDGMVLVDRAQLMGWLEGASLGATSSPLEALGWPDFAAVDRQFALNGHPEWDPVQSCDLPPTTPCVAGDPEFDWWSKGLLHQGTTRCWAPILLDYPLELSDATTPRREWILAVPCFTLSYPHNVEPVQIASPSLDTQFNSWMTAPKFGTDPETQDLLDHYSHGFVQFWRLTDRPIAASPAVPPTGIQVDPPGTSDLPYIILPHSETCAWRIASCTVGDAEDTQMFLFVADFGGHLYIYDVSNVPDLPRFPGLPNPMLTWNAPASIVDNYPLNVRAIAVDCIDDDNIYLYVGVSSFGIEVLRMSRNASGTSWQLSAAAPQIETSGTVHDIAIRPASTGLPKQLLVSDGPGGLRIFGEQ